MYHLFHRYPQYIFFTQGACLPQCSNGTNLLIPLAGAMNPEDFVVTGGCSHLNTQENAFYPLLYNFEEAEGELNFLTRIVALTFYPSNTGRCATSLGEVNHSYLIISVKFVQILGVYF